MYDLMHNNSINDPIYDAIVVGSGATGGIAAKELAERGLKVLVLEAGRDVNPQTDVGNAVTHMAKRIYNLSIARTQSFQALHAGYWKANPDFFVNETENPYTTPLDKPFNWTRGRQVGGKSLTWGGVTLRLSDYEFKAARHDGYGQNWPIAYADLAPYYDRLERFFQVQGNTDGLPQLPDGIYQSAASFSPAELAFKAAVEAQGPDRALIISRGFPSHTPTPDSPWPRASSVGTSLKTALGTGNVRVRSNAVVSHVTFEPTTRKAQGVVYVDRLQKTSHEVRGQMVVLCASTIESLRILLHSTEQHQTGGLANGNGLLGHGLMDHATSMRFFGLPGVAPSESSFPLSGSESFFIPRFCNLEKQNHDFLRGYGIWGGIQRLGIPPLLQKMDGAIGFLIAHGEVLANRDNHVSLNLNVKDAWGIPVAHIDYQYGQNEEAMVTQMNQEMETLIAQAGGDCRMVADLFYTLVFDRFMRRQQQEMEFVTPPGYYIHELGGACMGNRPDQSVLNANNQCWEAPNLLVTDGACWPTSAWQSPTLTEMALTARACEFIVKEARKGNV